MKLGLAMFPHAETLQPIELARLAEDHGFESLFFPEHSHVPIDDTPHPGGGEVPRAYKLAYDPLITLSAIAAGTERLRLGTGICLVAQRDPIYLAKETATLDVLSGGRLLFGVGAGWHDGELRNHGVEPRQRWVALEDRLAAVKTIWTSEEAEHHGPTARFGPMWLWPKPVQAPHPPILVGGNSEAAMRRAARVGTGWLPRARRNRERFGQDFARYREIVEEEGAERSGITVYEAQADREYLEFYAASDVERCVFMLPDEPADALRDRIDEIASVAEGLGL